MLHVAFRGSTGPVSQQASNLGPSWSGHSLRFLVSALDGSEVFSPIPLILNTYQQLKQEMGGGVERTELMIMSLINLPTIKEL